MDLRPGSRLSLSDKLRQTSVVDRVLATRDGSVVTAPLVVELDLTSYCDLACPECVSVNLLQQGRFSQERALELVDEFADAGVLAVVFIGGGEPLLHPAIGMAMRRCADRGLHVGLTTNGTQIDRYLEDIAECAAWTRVSVDASTAATYKEFRPDRGRREGTFERVIANMKLLAHAKRGALGYSYLLMSRVDQGSQRTLHNFDEVYAAAELARDIGCDYFEVKPQYDTGHVLVSQPAWLRERLSEQLRRVSGLATAGFEVIAPGHLAEALQGGDLTQPKSYATCPSTELRTVVTPSGAYLCPYHRGAPDARYGDAHTTPLAQLWSSPERQAARTRVDPSRACAFHCIRHASNEVIADPEAELLPVQDYDLFV